MTRLFLFSLLMAGMAMGQTPPAGNGISLTGIMHCYMRASGLCQTSPLTEAEKEEDAHWNDLKIPDDKKFCDQALTFGKSSKKVSEIFPAECPQASTSGTTPVPHMLVCTNDPNDHNPCVSAQTDPLSEFEEWKKNLDVPAIKILKSVGLRTMTDCPPLPDGTHGKSGNECYVAPVPQEYIYSCADPSRILLTDQSGKHHCLKFSEGK